MSTRSMIRSKSWSSMKPNLLLCGVAARARRLRRRRGSPPGSADGFASIEPFRFEWGANVHRRSLVADDSERMAIRPGRQRLGGR